MNANSNHLTGELGNSPENQLLDQPALGGAKEKTNRIIIVIENGRVVKYIQKTICKG